MALPEILNQNFIIRRATVAGTAVDSRNLVRTSVAITEAIKNAVARKLIGFDCIDSVQHPNIHRSSLRLVQDHKIVLPNKVLVPSSTYL